MNSESIVYDLRNPHLTHDEKFEVECWFQAPGDLMVAVFTALAVAYSFGYVPLYLVFLAPPVINAFVGLMNWFLYNKRVAQTVVWLVGIPPVVMIVAIGAGVVIALNGHWWLGLIVAAFGFGASAPLEPHIWIYKLLASPHGLHMKYLFFRRFYGRHFPFENSEQQSRYTAE